MVLISLFPAMFSRLADFSLNIRLDFNIFCHDVKMNER
jgi:hypothetical protein